MAVFTRFVLEGSSSVNNSSDKRKVNSDRGWKIGWFNVFACQILFGIAAILIDSVLQIE